MKPDGRVERILAAVDFDPTASAAIGHASEWARHFGAVLVSLHVIPDASTGDTDLEAASRELKALVARHVPGAEPEGESIVKLGRPGVAIRETASSVGADLIVVGSHGRSTVGRWVLGSVAGDVLRHAEVPVLVAKAAVGPASQGPLVAAVDFSSASEAAVRYAGQLAAESGASLCLLHVLPIGDNQSPGHVVMRETSTKSLRELQEKLVPRVVEVEVHVAMHMEAISKAVAHYAESQLARLIVMGGHGASGWRRGVLGSVTERLLHGTNLPVLVVPEPRDTAPATS